MRSMKTMLLAVALPSLLAMGCASTREERAEPATTSTAAQTTAQGGGQHGRMGHQHGTAGCPMRIPGTQVEAVDTETGIALSFTTAQSEHVEALQQSIRQLADAHNQMQQQPAEGTGGSGVQGCPCPACAEGQCPGCKAENCPGHATGECPCPMHRGHKAHTDAQFSAENTENGARLVMTPRKPEDLAQLRAEVRQHAEKMASGQCPMMKQK